MRKRILALAMAALLGVSAFTGCGGVYQKDDSAKNDTTKTNTSSDVTAAATATATGDKIFKYSINDEPPTLDPQLVNAMYGATLDYQLFEGLMRNNNGKLEPACAETYDLSEDGLTYTFHLRKGLKWSDGSDLTAKDFEYGMKRLVDPKTASPSSYMGTILKNASKVMAGEMTVDQLGVKATDDLTLEITLENPAGYFLGVLSTCGYYPCKQELVDKYGKDFSADADKNVYNGPFQLTDWQHQASLTMKKNTNYWNSELPKLDGVQISIVKDKNTALGMYESGELDYVTVPFAMAANYPTAQDYYTGGVEYLQLNVANEKNPILANKNFRNALSAAIDREQYVALATNNISEATSRYVLPKVNGASKTYGEEYPLDAFSTKSDTAAAQKYLADAMKECNIAKASDIKVVFNVADADSSRKSAEVIQEQLQKNLGIVIEINQVPYKQLYELHAKHDYEMMFTGWVPDYSDPFSYLEFFETGNGYNNSVYSSTDYDKYIQASKTTTDPKARLEALFEAEKILCSDLPIIPLDLTKQKYLLNPRVKDFSIYFVGTNENYISADITE